MIIIADSGSTKTHWLIIQNDGSKQDVYSQGINPYFLESRDIVTIITESFEAFPFDEVSYVYFYGAGCMGDKCEIVSSALSKSFPKANINTYSDLLASARALFGKKSGVACILGTGSNAAVYNGEEFIGRIQSYGYILGDEGSGSYIGRQILQSYLRKEMPEKLRQDFAQAYKLDRDFILERIYKKAFPNRYLAGFAAFAGVNRNNIFIQNIVRNAFGDFIKYQLTTLTFPKSLPIGFVGSIAFYFQDILSDELGKAGYSLATVLKEPINALADFHL